MQILQDHEIISSWKHSSLQPNEQQATPMVFVPIVQSARVWGKLKWRLGSRARRQWRRSKRYKRWDFEPKVQAYMCMLTLEYASICYATKAVLCRRTNGSCWRLARHQADLACNAHGQAHLVLLIVQSIMHIIVKQDNYKHFIYGELWPKDILKISGETHVAMGVWKR